MFIFPENMKMYKGNLHTHTNLSDGRASPEYAIERYKDHGYSFLAITDHNRYFKGFDDDGFMVLGGVEFDTMSDDKTRAWHVIGFGLEHEYSAPESKTIAGFSKSIIDAGGMAILGHPAWSLLNIEDLIYADDCFATEIYSSVSYLSGRGDSSLYTDTVTAKGCFKKILGVDDTHYYGTGNNEFLNWICVPMPSLSRENLFRTLNTDSFYCSQGPEIKQIEISDTTVKLYCSEVKKVTFFTNLNYEKNRIVYAGDSPLTSAEYTINPNIIYLRIECEDYNGNRACSQYLKFKNGVYAGRTL